jgi:hypothetical protein
LTDTTSTQKTNLQLILAAEFLSRFQLDIRHKAGKANIVPDMLPRLITVLQHKQLQDGDPELDTIYTEAEVYTASTYMQISDKLRQALIEGYRKDAKFSGIIKTITSNKKLGENAAQLPFTLREDLLYCKSIDGYLQKLCILSTCLKDVFIAAYKYGHPGFHKTSHILLSSAFFIPKLSRHLRDFLTHCPECKSV